MPSISYRIAGGLTDGQLDTIHRTALRVVEEIGVEITHPDMLGALTGRDGVRVDGHVVRFDAPGKRRELVPELRTAIQYSKQRSSRASGIEVGVQEDPPSLARTRPPYSRHHAPPSGAEHPHHLLDRAWTAILHRPPRGLWITNDHPLDPLVLRRALDYHLREQRGRRFGRDGLPVDPRTRRSCHP